jgi:hypothetical protein
MHLCLASEKLRAIIPPHLAYSEMFDLNSLNSNVTEAWRKLEAALKGQKMQ